MSKKAIAHARKGEGGSWDEPHSVAGGKSLAHFRKSADGFVTEQTVAQHLGGVARRARYFAQIAGLPDLGELLGLLHDIGKYSWAFQRYIRSAEGLIDPDSDDYVEATRMRGKIDHSTAGAQLAWDRLSIRHDYGRLAGELAALALASHHSGLIDCLSPSGEDVFALRLAKDHSQSHLSEVLAEVDSSIKVRVENLLTSSLLLAEIQDCEEAILFVEPTKELQAFRRGLLERFIFSCLIDADRLDSADFENPEGAADRNEHRIPNWDVLIDRLEDHLSTFRSESKVQEMRGVISVACAAAGTWRKGIYNLTVPTGGGKTLASLRFALRHAKEHQMERIIFSIPFTSIIEQNAKIVREILEPSTIERPGSIVLELHSNLLPERDSWLGKLLAENWDAPIVFTTNVQVLESMFAKGTRSARRFHCLGKSVIVFDEAQAIPITCVHMFNTTVNFLVEHCASTALMCTATQPLLHKVDPAKGALKLAQPAEIVPELTLLFSELKRVEIIDQRTNEGRSFDAAAEFGVEQLNRARSLLYIVNTKRAAQEIWRALKTKLGWTEGVFHLSTNMCPAHRQQVLEQVHQRLANSSPVVCVSTQLIEAGVDIDFEVVIRAHAGLDSIAQAAGRCNRNGCQDLGHVFIINLSGEDVSSLDDIRQGQKAAERVLRDIVASPEEFNNSIIGPAAMGRFYEYYFWDRAGDMAYAVGTQSPMGRSDNLLSVLGNNSLSLSAYSITHANQRPKLILRQSFKSAAESFKAIDAPTEAVLVPWGEGEQIIGVLNSKAPLSAKFAALREGQRYSVALRAGTVEKLRKLNVVKEIADLGVLQIVDAHYYSEEFGLNDKGDGRLGLLYG